MLNGVTDHSLTAGLYLAIVKPFLHSGANGIGFPVAVR
jgi:hypothetical protein